MSYQKLSGGRRPSTLQGKEIHSPLNSALSWPLRPPQEQGTVGSCKHPWSSESEGVLSPHWLCDRLYASGPIAYWKASSGLCWPSKFRSGSWLISPGTRTIKGKEWICLTCPLSETLLFEPNPKQRISCLTLEIGRGQACRSPSCGGSSGLLRGALPSLGEREKQHNGPQMSAQLLGGARSLLDELKMASRAQQGASRQATGPLSARFLTSETEQGEYWVFYHLEIL